ALIREGTSITLTAQPGGGERFAGWGGDCGGSGDCTVTMDGPKGVSASFEQAPPPPPPKYTLTITKAGSGTGYVGGGGGIDCGPVCSASENSGAQFQLV